ncbi:conserved hypothetical protein [Halorhabdus utahensis DSM 12940]|uniref:Uncharacterized protein n=1 Tax=Halorhabdus utahensis (strain DSM 12940 / JCM 11049 / AX-2) TaxID=519442 RepID=C7NNQ8_HALUD|nr:hypothetical protein [Halorhabdus utahensis]ACV11583.1 conserved hypothetical protein [Halorhabdus utahensis DSM 12940]
MAAGILELIGRVGTVVVVAPIALLSLDLLVRGELVGGLAFLGIVGLILAVERYVITPSEIPRVIASRLVGSALSVDESDDEE